MVNTDTVSFPGVFGLLWYAAWIFMAYDSPSVHPTITDDERVYIEQSAVHVNEVQNFI